LGWNPRRFPVRDKIHDVQDFSATLCAVYIFNIMCLGGQLMIRSSWMEEIQPGRKKDSRLHIDKRSSSLNQNFLW
jgi:hypothetical protein